VVEVSAAICGPEFSGAASQHGEPGRKVGERWLRTCDSRAIFTRRIPHCSTRCFASTRLRIHLNTAAPEANLLDAMRQQTPA
jgi:hypothetical protein